MPTLLKARRQHEIFRDPNKGGKGSGSSIIVPAAGGRGFSRSGLQVQLMLLDISGTATG